MADWEDVARQLVTRRYDALVAYAAMVASSRSSAEDLVQEALVATFSRPRGLADVVVAESYVRRAILTRHLDATRKASRERKALARAHQDGVLGEFTAGPEGAVTIAHDLRWALQQLTPRERVCVMLRHFENLSTREAAQAAGISEGSVKRYLSDGMAKLNAALGTSDEVPDTVPVSAGKGVAR